MSLCDKCYAPGHCCRGFTLTGADGHPPTTWVDEGPEAAEKLMIERQKPFRPLRVQEVFTDPTGRKWQTWQWMCAWLGEDGRCQHYDDRPDVCRDFEPGSGPLCAMHTGESGDGSAPYAMGWDREYEGTV